MAKYYTKISDEDGNEFLLAVNITGHGAPTEDTEADPGMCYLDEDSEHGDLYKCIGVLVTETRTVYRWKKLAGQEEVERLEKAIAELPQPDWHQNDETAKDFVKNRPFYTGDYTETVLFDGTVASMAEISVSLTAGKRYICTLDGVEYILIAQAEDEIAYIGSESLFWDEEYVDTEPPFVCANGAFYTINKGDNHTLKIVADVTEIKTIPEEYIPHVFVKKDKLEHGIAKPIQLNKLVNFGLPLYDTDGTRSKYLSAEDWEFAYEIASASSEGKYLPYSDDTTAMFRLNDRKIEFATTWLEWLDVGVEFTQWHTFFEYNNETETVTATYTVKSASVSYS